MLYFNKLKWTDKPIIDRQNEYKKSNISVCEEDCIFSEYDNLNKKALCSCFTKLKLIDFRYKS